MAEMVYEDELSPYERSCLLGAPFIERRVALPSNRDIIVYHKLNPGQLYWLAKELGYRPWSDTLAQVLDAIFWDEPVYSFYLKKKGSGGFRKILVPMDPLKDVQRRILKNILALYHVSEHAFGYSGGNVFDTLLPHLEAQNGSLLSTDIEDAFGSVHFGAVFEAIYGLPLGDSYQDYQEKGYLSWEVAYAISRIVTCGERLPQGASTSPRLFDMVFLPIDRKLKHLAENVGGIYTRYADNIYFSMPQEEFPEVVARAIIRTIHENRHHKDSYGLMEARRFRCHETRVRSLNSGAIRALGVNLVGGEIYPTRALKKRIRLSAHRLNWLLVNTPYDADSIAECWGKLQGQMSFASNGTLPESLQRQYERTKANYEGLIFNGEVPTT